MQGVVIDDKGVYVKAAIVKLFKTQDSEDESDSEAITYALTDDDGRFVIHYLNPDEKYAIEIHVDNSDSNAQSDEPESADETDDTDEINDQVLAT
ncbi:MAG TPA: hypothetical protein VM577_06945, partial [Anaerovoracaceae bacterium]|nr:hypothetical protein [Anaerovoracaceae bacterium]